MNQPEGQVPPSGAGNTRGSEDVVEQLLLETRAMARYALASGVEIPAGIFCIIEDTPATCADRTAVARVHNQLAKLVAPAKPGTIRILEDERRNTGALRYLGPINLIRWLMMVSILFVAAFVGLATRTDAGAASARVANTGEGWSLSVVAYLLAAAGVGAAFAALWRVNRYVEEVTYDRTYDASYWILIVLGLIAGLILALVIPIDSVAGQTTFSKPLLALLGGFAASAVHRILLRLVEVVESIVRGDPREEAKAKERQVAADRATERTGVAARLVALERGLVDQADPQVARGQIRDLLAELFPDVTPPPPVTP